MRVKQKVLILIIKAVEAIIKKAHARKQRADLQSGCSTLLDKAANFERKRKRKRRKGGLNG